MQPVGKSLMSNKWLPTGWEPLSWTLLTSLLHWNPLGSSYCPHLVIDEPWLLPVTCACEQAHWVLVTNESESQETELTVKLNYSLKLVARGSRSLNTCELIPTGLPRVYRVSTVCLLWFLCKFEHLTGTPGLGAPCVSIPRDGGIINTEVYWE